MTKQVLPLLVAAGLALACGGESNPSHAPGAATEAGAAGHAAGAGDAGTSGGATGGAAGHTGSGGQSTGGNGGRAEGGAAGHPSAGADGGNASGKGGIAGTGASARAGSGGTSMAGTGGVAAEGNVCDDYVAPAATLTRCRSDAECLAPGNYCTPPGATSNYCGTCQTPSRDCETADDCGTGLVCVELDLTCPCPSALGKSSQCRPACDANSCGDGNRCNAMGLCEPTPCDDGYTCGDGFSCDTAGIVKDIHGCVAVRCEDGFVCPVNTRCSAKTGGHGCASLACETDTDCDCGACVLKACASGPGVCTAAVG